jgi:hypothetical protein
MESNGDWSFKVFRVSLASWSLAGMCLHALGRHPNKIYHVTVLLLITFAPGAKPT